MLGRQKPLEGMLPFKPIIDTLVNLDYVVKHDMSVKHGSSIALSPDDGSLRYPQNPNE
jgi:hypothetical protein